MNGTTIFTLLSVLCAVEFRNDANAQLLGSAESFAILGGSTVTNTGQTTLSGNLGVWPGTSITGFPPGIVTNGTIHAGDAFAQKAQADLAFGYDTIANQAFNFDLSGQDLGGLTLTPGVYRFSSTAQLTGILTLDAQGDPNAQFHFQIGSALTTASNSEVRVINAVAARNLYWQIGSSATLGTSTSFQGRILAMASITMTTNSTIFNGSALARTGAVTLDSNTVAIDPIPEPLSFAALSAGLAFWVLRRRKVAVI